MSRNKTLIGLGDTSVDVQRADDAVRDLNDARSELTMIRRRIRTFFLAVTQVSFPAIPEGPAWAEDWPEWLQTGEVAVDRSEEELTQAQQQALDESAEMPGGIPTT